MAVCRHMEGRMILLVGILLAFLPDKSESATYLLVNRTCALNYQCPDVDGLKCRVYLFRNGCPIQTTDTENLIPSDPKNVTVWKSSTKRDGVCHTGFTIGWIPPNDNGAVTLEGLELRVTMMYGPYIGVENCIWFDFNGTKWTPELIEKEIPFRYECFNSPPLGEYNVRLQSLPKPKYDQTVSSHIDRTVTVNGRECEPPTTFRPPRPTPEKKVVPQDPQDPNESSDLKLPVWALAAVAGTCLGLVITLTSVGIYKCCKRKPRGNPALLNNSRINDFETDWQTDVSSGALSEPFSVPPDWTGVSPLAACGKSISTTQLYDAGSCCRGQPYHLGQPHHLVPPINEVQTSDLGDSIPTPTYDSGEIIA